MWCKTMKYLLASMCLFACSLGAIEKMYINIDDLDTTNHSFKIHVGKNRWIQTNAIHTDSRGVYTFESDVRSIDCAWVKEWRCPYCNQYWPIGTACQDSECPSKYR